MRGIQVTTCRICKLCGAITHNKCGYCDECYDKKQKQKEVGWAITQKEKGTSTERGYGYAWQKLRLRVIKRDKGLCQECLRKGFVTAGTDVDHIVAKCNGGTDDLDNLQLLCKECHREKTLEDKRRG